MNRVNSKNIEPSLKEYFSIITSTTSRSDALKSVAALGIKHFGEYITPGSLNLSDEIEINFIEILDQIIFELSGSSDTISEIKDYITDDLYSRFSLTLEALADCEKYKANLKNRPLYTEDLIIIRRKNLKEFIPLLIAESEDITNLEKNILKTLLYFTEQVHLDYFYNIFRNTSSGYIKSAALLGMKYSSKSGLNWNSVKDISNGLKELVEYAENFNTEEICSNRLPENMEEMTFILLHLEKNINIHKSIKEINWILTVFSIVPLLNFENSWLTEINISLSNIILQIDINLMREILKNESALIRATNFIDYLPRNVFNRLTGRLDDMGMEFIYNLNLVIEKKKKSMDAYNSNILTYISWNPIESL
ncbi:MAG TPA: hypothetical protein P5120_07040 [Spirochaetota bacterium]|nr:hypothetical protein [Spirochaetota bacterium]HPF05143.1 hypothetical protein [Spirochaetota bacterium]HPJ42565.1 hypothetical protein [Spirochaetota bacterium]HPR36272.1 hypothetical protein [Spirochaetota bacterium]HRX47257.1 hypothetical protein [Spirochaetota bacterium]